MQLTKLARIYVPILLVASSLLSGCATEVKNVSGPQDVQNGSLLVGTFEVRSSYESARREGCAVEIGLLDSMDSYTFHFNQENDAVILDLAPGIYEFKSVYCGRLSRTIIRRQRTSFTNFIVKPGRNNFFGHIVLIYKESETSLAIHRGISPIASAKRLLATLKKISQKPLISPYTDKEVTEEMLTMEDAKYSIAMKFEPAVGRDGQLQAKIDECMKDEQKRNPLRYHGLVIEAQFAKGKLQQISETKGMHAYTDELKSCVKNQLSSWRPEVKDVKVRAIL